MKSRTIAYYIIGFLIGTMLFLIPFDQLIEENLKVTYTSNDENRIEATFGGPRVTWVIVECNVTAEISFLYPNGTWIATENVLLASTNSSIARFNYDSQHPTTIVEVIGEEPFIVDITYIYPVVIQMSFFGRLLYSYGLLH